MRPAPSEYHPALDKYVSLIPESDLAAALAAQLRALQAGFATVTAAQETYCYAPGKWSVRQVLGHLTDSERIFGYRVLAIARGETANLPPFDEDVFAANAGHDRVPLATLLAEFVALRQSLLLLLPQFDDAAWTRVGKVSNNPITARAIAYVMAGHARHHASVLATRYALAITG